MNPIVWILVSILPCFAFGKVRTVQVKKDQIVTVHTALGVATIVQVPDQPNSIVVGNQSAFKVEYLDQAITIKPLHAGAKSNLYIYTDYRRFNVQLVAGAEGLADYVVYLENPKAKLKSPSLRWFKFKNYLKNESLVFETKSLAKTSDDVLLIEFEIRSAAKARFNPDWLWLTQKGISRPIHSLALSSQDLSSDHSIKGIIQVLRSDVFPTDAIRIEIRRRKLSYLTIPKDVLWK